MIRDARQRTRAIKGTALLLALVGGAFLIFFLDDILAQFVRRYTVVVVMESAPRVIQGSPVWIGGKRIGTVTKVRFLPSDADTMSTVAVTLELPRRHRGLVRADSRVRMGSARRISEPAVDIMPGTAAARELAPGDTLRMHAARSPMELTAQARVVRGELDSLMREVRALMPALHARADGMSRSFAALEAAMAETNRLRTALSAGPGIAQLRNGTITASLDRTRAHLAQLSSLVDASRERISNGELRVAFGRLQQQADSLRAQLDAVAFETGFFARSRSDSALHHAIVGARTELDSLIAQTKRNPLRFFF